MISRTVTIEELASYYMEHLRPVGLVVDDEVVLSQAIKAVRYYTGYGDLAFLESNEVLNKSTKLDKSEVAVISPLFELYVERENALILESSRSQGVEVYGRTVSEVMSDITQKELEIQNLAFEVDFFTV